MANVIIRNFDPDARERIKRASQARGMTMGEYLSRCAEAVDRMRALADTPTSDGRWEQVGVELESLGLQTVRS